MVAVRTLPAAAAALARILTIRICVIRPISVTKFFAILALVVMVSTGDVARPPIKGSGVAGKATVGMTTGS